MSSKKHFILYSLLLSVIPITLANNDTNPSYPIKETINQNISATLIDSKFYQQQPITTYAYQTKSVTKFINQVTASDIAESNYKTGNAYWTKHNYSRAEYWYMEAAKYNHLPALKMLTFLYLDQSRQQEALIIHKMHEISPLASETLFADSLLANFYIQKQDYDNAYIEHVKLMRKNPDLTLRFYIQNSLAWLILNGYGTKQDINKAIDLYYDFYRDSDQANRNMLINEATQAMYFTAEEKQLNFLFLDIVSGTNFVSATEKKALFTALLPNNPKAQTQFYQYINTLKKTDPKDIKSKYTDIFVDAR